uniref:Uncharacterized protein n=1 Tax=Romanomermis culicivorax TaxID=13658 RepID=A0A915IHQ0_ROMCU
MLTRNRLRMSLPIHLFRNWEKIPRKLLLQLNIQDESTSKMHQIPNKDVLKNPTANPSQIPLQQATLKITSEKSVVSSLSTKLAGENYNLDKQQDKMNERDERNNAKDIDEEKSGSSQYCNGAYDYTVEVRPG